MQLQRTHISIVRSIRHVSLVRDWQRSRGGRAIPNFADFMPDARAGDAAELLVCEVRRDGERLSYFCQAAGERVEQLCDINIRSRYLHDCMDAGLAAAGRPIWDACVHNSLPVYSIVPLSDRNGCPVTLEQIFLPYGRGDAGVHFMLAALHAWSTEGRFAIHGLLRQVAKAPPHWAVVIDPALPVAPKPATGADETIVFG
jgi:hypothetical protein